MPRRVVSVLVAFLAVLTSAPVRAQEGTVELSASEVLLDLVVTDSKGRPILDLRPGEIEVYEQGERQEVTSFGLVRVGPREEGEPAPVATAAPAPLALSPFRDYNLVMLVIDRTSIQSAHLKAIHDAARSFVERDLAQNDLVGVFAVGTRLLMVQNFSNDREVLLEAIRRATTPFEGTGDVVLTADANARRTRVVPIRPQLPVATGGADPAAGKAAQAPVDTLTPLLNDIAANTEAAVAYVEEQVQSESFIRGILTLLKMYGGVRDRKSVLLYSEGVSLTNTNASQFTSLIGYANRSGFTFYTVDAAGLRTGAGADVKPREPLTIGQQNDMTRDRTLVSRGDSELGRAERELRTNDNAALSRLASDTGGLFVRNTNDLQRGFERLAADLRSHYALTYAPKNTAFDGTFRTIEVKVARKDARVRTRSGYFAVPGGPGSLLLEWEQPILALLNTTQRPSDLKAGVAVERFATPDGWHVPVLVSVTGAGLDPLPKAKGAKAEDPDDFEVDVVALVRDASRNVVAKLSRRNVLGVPKDRLAAFRGTYYTLAPFGDRVMLKPGSYTVEVAFYDPSSKRATVVERAFTVGETPQSGAPAVSSLVLGRGAQKADAAAAGDPFVVPGGARVEPSPEGRFVKALGDRLVPYFRFYGKPGGSYKMKLDFLRSGRAVISTGELPLPVDAKGEAVVARAFGLDAFEPGDYTARVTIIIPDGAPITISSDFRVE